MSDVLIDRKIGFIDDEVDDEFSFEKKISDHYAEEVEGELQSEDLYNDCVRELYKSNEAHQLQLSKKDINHLY